MSFANLCEPSESAIKAQQLVPVPIQQYASPRGIPIKALENPQYTLGPTLISNDHDKAIANVFCFGAFSDKNTGIVYHDMTGNFPFMSLDGNVCYFIMYHYESNSILTTAIDGLDDKTIFAAYKQ